MLEKPDTLLRCACGYRIYAELNALGAGNSTVALFDDEP